MSTIRQWLEGLGLAQYADAFEANDIDPGLLPRVTDQVLKDVGVTSAGHRLRILGAIEDLSASKQLAADAPSGVASPSNEGERRYATVLFSDLSGYTAMNERLDPEVVANLAGRIKAEAVRIVEAHGGIVNQFVGDEILALFGVPTTHEDDPVRTVRAAMALHRMVRDMAPEIEARIGQPLRLHSGIDTGLVVTSLRDRRDGTYGVTGDTVNLGARLAAEAPADELWVSPQTHNRIRDYFETESLPPVALKGKAAPLTPYRVIRPTRAETRFQAAQRRGLTGYVGRGSELATLLACLDKAIGGDGQLVAVIGEAGAGKSRIVFEFRSGLERDKVGVVEGRCQAYGTETPYLPFLDALRRALELREDDSPDQLLDKVVANVRAIDPALERFLPHYLRLLSVPTGKHPLPAQLHGAERKHAFEEALAAIFTLGSRRRPLVVVLEDWHWVDPTSDAVLKHLVGLVDRYPLMIILLCRPEYDLNWASPAQVSRIVLKPLSVEETGAMASRALRGAFIPDDLKQVVFERTAGNPLFIEEVCLTLLEENVIAVSEGRATLARRIEAAHLPDTVQAVIRARIDRLDSQTQEVLRLASVIGREFARTLLERMVAPKDIVGATLEALNAQDLIRQVRVLPEPEYMFKHVLTQVVVYETLLLMRRQALHELVGQAIEELYADRVEEHYESLAHHYRLSDNREKAIRYLELAGDKAKRQYVLEQTVKNYRQAIELLDGLDKTAKRMRQHIDIAIKWADLIVPSVELIGALRIATSFAEQLGDDDRLAKSASFLGQMLYYTGDFDGAVPELQRVIAMSSVLDDQDRVGSSYRVLGQLYLNTSRRAEGLECLEKARPIVRRTQNRFEESCAVGLIATEYGLTGRFEESRALFDEAVRIARAGGERSIEAWEGVWRASVLCARGAWDEAIATCDEAIELGRRIENVWVVTWSTIRKGYALFMAGDQQAGLALTGEAVQQLEGPRPLVNVAAAFGRLAEMLGLAGRGDEAAPYAEKALAHLRTGTGYTAETRAYRARAIASAARGDWASVDSDMQKSLVNAKTFEYRPELGVGYFRYAELLRDKGEPERAHEQLDQAVELFTALDMTWWMEQADRLRVRLSPS